MRTTQCFTPEELEAIFEEVERQCESIDFEEAFDAVAMRYGYVPNTDRFTEFAVAHFTWSIDKSEQVAA